MLEKRQQHSSSDAAARLPTPAAPATEATLTDEDYSQLEAIRQAFFARYGCSYMTPGAWTQVFSNYCIRKNWSEDRCETTVAAFLARQAHGSPPVP